MSSHICHMSGNLLVVRTTASLSQAHSVLIWWGFPLVLNCWSKDCTCVGFLSKTIGTIYLTGILVPLCNSATTAMETFPW